MTRFRLGALAGAAALGTALSAAGAAAPALAAAHAPHVCPAGEWYSVSGSKPYFILHKATDDRGGRDHAQARRVLGHQGELGRSPRPARTA